MDNTCSICLSKFSEFGQDTHVTNVNNFSFDCIGQSVQCCGLSCPLCRSIIVDQEFELVSNIESYLYKDLTSRNVNHNFRL